MLHHTVDMLIEGHDNYTEEPLRYTNTVVTKDCVLISGLQERNITYCTTLIFEEH